LCFGAITLTTETHYVDRMGIAADICARRHRRARQVPQELQKRSANVRPPTVVNDQTVLARGQEGLGDTGADASSAERVQPRYIALAVS
jgi:hypothetical protein